MVEQTHSEAIVLNTVPYSENDRIATLLFPYLGKCTAYLAGKEHAWIEPLTLLSTLASPGKKDFLRLKEPAPLDLHLPLRQNFLTLKSALEMIRFTSRFLPPKAPRPLLFKLLKIYLHKLKFSKNPSSFFCSFVLKTLFSEGLLFVETDGSLKAESLSLSPHLSPLLFSRNFAEIDSLEIAERDLFTIQGWCPGIAV